MELAQILIYIGMIGIIVFSIPGWFAVSKLYKDILSLEPNFIKKNRDFGSDFASRPMLISWIIYRGKHKFLKNAKLIKRCHIQRIFLVLTNLFFALAFLATLYMALMHYVH